MGAPDPCGTYPSRYPTLDALRGVASSMVLVWHMYWNRVPGLSPLWIGVQLFFVISGYCIASAAVTARAQGMSFGTFMRRRLRRIGVPYLASLFVALAVRYGIVAHLYGFAALALVRRSAGFWIRNLTMTQWLSLFESWLSDGRGLPTPWNNPDLLLGIHWSLNYEEQFYLLAGVSLLLPALARTRVTLGVFTAGVAVVNALAPGRVTGLFLDYWLQFFCGIWVFVRLCQSPTHRQRLVLDGVLVAAVVVVSFCAWERHEYPLSNSVVQFYPQLAICLAFGGVLTGLRPLDSVVMGSAPGSLLGAIGKFSYSLYLVHRPALELFGHLGWLPASGPSDLLLAAGVFAFSYLFYRFFEKPFLNATWPGNAPDVPDRSRNQNRNA